jgi:hypothetical protein
MRIFIPVVSLGPPPPAVIIATSLHSLCVFLLYVKQIYLTTELACTGLRVRRVDIDTKDDGEKNAWASNTIFHRVDRVPGFHSSRRRNGSHRPLSHKPMLPPYVPFPLPPDDPSFLSLSDNLPPVCISPWQDNLRNA